jgi:predicted DNA-binding protein with PD1-like motif
MKSKLLNEQNGSRTFVVVFERGEHVMEPLLEFLKGESVTAARLTGIGALESVTLGYFDWETKEYEQHRISGQVELLSLAGDVALKNGEPQVHAHVVLGCRDTSTLGGHLLDATVRPTLELIIEDAPAELRKTVDPESGLALISPEL